MYYPIVQPELNIQLVNPEMQQPAPSQPVVQAKSTEIITPLIRPMAPTYAVSPGEKLGENLALLPRRTRVRVLGEFNGNENRYMQI